ncbi:hypothetical protein HPB51_027111 [Rhipicephalus microplus]|uniref:Uncharacterized protein n=1 Tax=Rhipicephalus microplus TaxID=6941 RepID=A0A9J6D1D8_RHIMP|nr:hypothetical protein HPB51_027111 [Rhipicephalus microplus]
MQKWVKISTHKSRPPEDNPQEVQQQRQIDVFLVSLIVVGLGLLFILVVFTVVFGYQSQGDATTLDKDIEMINIMKLSDPNIPASNQLSWQKAGAMFEACLSFVSSTVPETKYLVKWMVDLNLDFTNETRLADVNPVEMMVRGSLDLGVHAVITVAVDETRLVNNKKPIQKTQGLSGTGRRLDLDVFTHRRGGRVESRLNY